MELVKGTSPMVDKGPEDTVTSWPHLLLMEILVVLGVTLLLLAMGIFINAPLRELANPDITENPAKAPWYFLNLQELLLHMHPSLAGVIVPGAILVLLMMVPYFDRNKADIGIWFASPKGRRLALIALLYTPPILLGLIFFNEYVVVRTIISEPELIPSWLIPLGTMGFFTGLLLFIFRASKPTFREVLVGLFTAFVVTYFITTIVSTVFRGYGMHLTWPWELPPGALTF